MSFLVCMYYTHAGYQTSVFGKNCAYYIRIFTVVDVVVIFVTVCFNISLSFCVFDACLKCECCYCGTFLASSCRFVIFL